MTDSGTLRFLVGPAAFDTSGSATPPAGTAPGEVMACRQRSPAKSSARLLMRQKPSWGLSNVSVLLIGRLGLRSTATVGRAATIRRVSNPWRSYAHRLFLDLLARQSVVQERATRDSRPSNLSGNATLDRHHLASTPGLKGRTLRKRPTSSWDMSCFAYQVCQAPLQG